MIETDGARSIRIFLRGSDSLRDNLLSTKHGGGRLTRGLVESAEQEFPGHPLDVTWEHCDGAASFLAALTATNNARSSIRDIRPDLVVLSVDSDLLGSAGSWGEDLATDFETNMLEVIRLIKSELGSRLIVLNASSLDPDEDVSNYRLTDKQPHSLEAHRLNLATMHLSMEEGISIIDVDRVIAGLGGAEHVLQFLNYSPQACAAICSEFLRVVQDYGFFDDRPLLPQAGRSGSSVA